MAAVLMEELTGQAGAVEGMTRQLYLEALYRADGREEKSHPLHGRYTGLREQRLRQLEALDRVMLAIEDWRSQG